MEVLGESWRISERAMDSNRNGGGGAYLSIHA